MKMCSWIRSLLPKKCGDCHPFPAPIIANRRPTSKDAGKDLGMWWYRNLNYKELYLFEDNTWTCFKRFKRNDVPRELPVIPKDNDE